MSSVEDSGGRWRQRRSFWTWGYESDEPDEAARRKAAESVSNRFGRAVQPPPIPKLADVTLRASRVKIPTRCRPS